MLADEEEACKLIAKCYLAHWSAGGMADEPVTAHGLEVVVGIAEGSRADSEIAGEALERAVIAAGANIAHVPMRN